MIYFCGRGKQEAVRGAGREKRAFHLENNNILIVLGAGEKKQRTEENKNSFEKCCFKVIKLNVSKPDSWLSQTKTIVLFLAC